MERVERRMVQSGASVEREMRRVVQSGAKWSAGSAKHCCCKNQVVQSGVQRKMEWFKVEHIITKEQKIKTH